MLRRGSSLLNGRHSSSRGFEGAPYGVPRISAKSHGYRNSVNLRIMTAVAYARVRLSTGLSSPVASSPRKGPYRQPRT